MNPCSHRIESDQISRGCSGAAAPGEQGPPLGAAPQRAHTPRQGGARPSQQRRPAARPVQAPPVPLLCAVACQATCRWCAAPRSSSTAGGSRRASLPLSPGSGPLARLPQNPCPCPRRGPQGPVRRRTKGVQRAQASCVHWQCAWCGPVKAGPAFHGYRSLEWLYKPPLWDGPASRKTAPLAPQRTHFGNVGPAAARGSMAGCCPWRALGASSPRATDDTKGASSSSPPPDHHHHPHHLALLIGPTVT
jgi:hypothetical protein